MEMTFDQYIQNPMGRENAVISNRTMYANLYKSKLDKILVREAGKIEHKCYSVGRKYICYLKIPSEVIPKFYYDVLIEFRPPKKLVTGAGLKDYNVRFYSNDPSFVYTFAHAFIKNDLFITNYSDKMSQKAIKQVAKEKNPGNQVGYVKSLYFAYLFMKSRGLFNRLRYVDPYSESAVKKQIDHADKKIKDRQEAASHKAKTNKKERAQEKELQDDRNNISNSPISFKVGSSRVTKTSSMGSKTKKIGSISKTKRKR